MESRRPPKFAATQASRLGRLRSRRGGTAESRDDLRRAPTGALQAPLLTLEVESALFISVRRESGADRFWISDEERLRQPLMFFDEPQVYPAGRPPRSLVLAGESQAVSAEAQTVEVTLRPEDTFHASRAVASAVSISSDVGDRPSSIPRRRSHLGTCSSRAFVTCRCHLMRKPLACQFELLSHG